MFAVGAVGLWGGLILAIRNYFKVEREQAERDAEDRPE